MKRVHGEEASNELIIAVIQTLHPADRGRWYDSRNRTIGCLSLLGVDFDNILPIQMNNGEVRTNDIAKLQKQEAIHTIDEIGLLLKKRIGIKKMSIATGLTLDQIKEIKSLIHE